METDFIGLYSVSERQLEKITSVHQFSSGSASSLSNLRFEDLALGAVYKRFFQSNDSTDWNFHDIGALCAFGIPAWESAVPLGATLLWLFSHTSKRTQNGKD